MEDPIDAPIVAGAKYRTIDGEVVRVKSVWVDEDLTTQVRIDHETHNGRPDSKTIDLDTFVSRIGSTDLKRVNTDHEAWEWRKERDRGSALEGV